MLSQSQIARYLDQCTDNDGVDEVLSAYVLSLQKMVNGLNCAQVLYKLHLLCCYLQVTNRGHILRLGQEGFKAICIELSLGGERIGRSPVYGSRDKSGNRSLERTPQEQEVSPGTLHDDSTYGAGS
ncbi:hypothetical protein CPB85DRAFT_940020 [Mucidula mucida]|nr:hypothetical protein CPB85DRAFT_940020 [Mucidula mucida]